LDEEEIPATPICPAIKRTETMRETTSVPKNKKKINNEIILPLDKIAAH
jgi:hypothetical protein